MRLCFCWLQGPTEAGKLSFLASISFYPWVFLYYLLWRWFWITMKLLGLFLGGKKVNKVCGQDFLHFKDIQCSGPMARRSMTPSALPGNPQTSQPPWHRSDHPSFYCTVNVLIGLWLSRHGGNRCRYSMLGKKGGAVCNILSGFPGLLSSAVSGPIPYRTGTGPAGAQETMHFQHARTGPPLVCQPAQSRCLLNAGELWNIIGNLEIDCA